MPAALHEKTVPIDPFTSFGFILFNRWDWVERTLTCQGQRLILEFNFLKKNIQLLQSQAGLQRWLAKEQEGAEICGVPFD